MASFAEEDDIIDEYFRYYKPKTGDTVYDLGAHCGFSTFHFSKAVGESGRVIAFEPDPINYQLLVNNMRRHNLRNVTCLQVAITGSRGTAEFHSEGTIGSMLKSLSTRCSTGSVATVETMSLADAFADWGVPEFCKIDIEGAEIEVIAAALDTLKDLRVHFAFDTSHVVDGIMTNVPIENLFRRCGYDAVSDTVSTMTTWANPKALHISTNRETKVAVLTN